MGHQEQIHKLTSYSPLRTMDIDTYHPELNTQLHDTNMENIISRVEKVDIYSQDPNYIAPPPRLSSMSAIFHPQICAVEQHPVQEMHPDVITPEQHTSYQI